MNIDIKKTGMFYGLIIGGFIIGSIILTIIQKKEWSEYTTITYDSKLNGKVVKIIDNRGISFEFNNGQKIFFPDSDNLNYNPSYIGSFINIGDSIFKLKNSDSIFVFRNNMKYFFIVNKRVDKKPVFRDMQ